MSKRLAAVAMQNRIGATFDAIVTGVTGHGTFVRALQPRVEGLLAQGAQGLDVGDKLKVKLIRTDVQHGLSISSGRRMPVKVRNIHLSSRASIRTGSYRKRPNSSPRKFQSLEVFSIDHLLSRLAPMLKLALP